ncbi:MAG: hypothetical protein AB8B85_04575 [Paracoccaceae bacterium]
MIRTLIAAALAALMALPAAAEGEFAEGSEVKGWKNLAGRENAKFKAKVVDLLCELSGDCAEKCGEGRRQMGLIREADGKLILAAKNRQGSFNGATVDLYPYCGKTVTVDGLMVGDPEVTDTKFYQVFFIAREGSNKMAKTARWTRDWQRRNPDLKDELKKVKNRWFRIDPAVQAAIAENGYLGLGAEVDKAFIAENY